jgi:chromate transporter
MISAGIFAVMAVLAFKKVHPIIIICISAAVGVLAGILGI